MDPDLAKTLPASELAIFSELLPELDEHFQGLLHHPGCWQSRDSVVRLLGSERERQEISQQKNAGLRTRIKREKSSILHDAAGTRGDLGVYIHVTCLKWELVTTRAYRGILE